MEYNIDKDLEKFFSLVSQVELDFLNQAIDQCQESSLTDESGRRAVIGPENQVSLPYIS